MCAEPRGGCAKISESRERETSAPQDCLGRQHGHDPHAEIMILALAMSHIVERPAIRMEGGALVLWSGTPAAVRCFVLNFHTEISFMVKLIFCANRFHHETHFNKAFSWAKSPEKAQ